jgi:hypothetical protein
MGEVGLQGARGNEQPVADVLVAQPLADEANGHQPIACGKISA